MGVGGLTGGGQPNPPDVALRVVDVCVYRRRRLMGSVVLWVVMLASVGQCERCHVFSRAIMNA